MWETTALQDDSNEFAAELQAIRWALQLLTRQPPTARPKQVTICTDCQAAIMVIHKPGQQSGQYLVRAILKLGHQLRSEGTELTLYWVPGHMGIPGNEVAHNHARLATRNQQQRPPPGWQHPRLKSTALRVGKATVLRERKRLLQQAEHGKQLYRLDQALPRNHMVKAYNSMSYEESRILVQLRTGHNGLHSHLHKIKKAESPQCECGLGEETVAHFLFLCPRWTGCRQPLRQTMGDRWTDLSYALGGWTNRRNGSTGQMVNGERSKWVPNGNVMKAVVRFVKATGRFQPTPQVVEQRTGP
jgi:ribonuclease HI